MKPRTTHLISFLIVLMFMSACAGENNNPIANNIPVNNNNLVENHNDDGSGYIWSQSDLEADTAAVIEENPFVKWEQGEVEDGLYLDHSGDVDTEVVSVGTTAQDARRTGNGQVMVSLDGNDITDFYMQFGVDDTIFFKGSPLSKVQIEVEYYDEGTDSFSIHYDALSGGIYGDGTFKDTEPVTKTDSQTFKTAVFILEDAYFANRINGADFRINDWSDGAEIIRSVTVTFLDETTASSFQYLMMVAKLSDIQGEVLVRQVGMDQFYLAQEGHILYTSGEILTGSNASVFLTISDGAVVYLGPNSIFTLEMGIYSEEIVMPRFELRLGEIEIVSGSSGFLVYTPTALVGAIGSQAKIKVSTSGGFTVDCYSGGCFSAQVIGAVEGLAANIPFIELVSVLISELKETQHDKSSQATIEFDPLEKDRIGVIVECLEENCISSDEDSDLPPEFGTVLLEILSDTAIMAGSQSNNNPLFTGGGPPDTGLPVSSPVTHTIILADPDGDGVPIDLDLCPEEGSVGWGVDAQGCPLNNSFEDADGDGIVNGKDLCPNLSSYGNTGFISVDENGCPIPPPDWDGDGWPDHLDLCPTVYAPNLLLWDGCPYGDSNHNGVPDDYECTDEDCYICAMWFGDGDCPGDSDGDGIHDGIDLCPDNYAWTSTGSNSSANPLDSLNPITMGYLATSTGCPVGDDNFDGIPDNVECEDCVHPLGDEDRDRVPDALDECPQKGDEGYGVDSNG